MNNQMSETMYWMQLQPHFIYNCLDAIQYLIKEDSDKAQEAVKKLSLLLRNYIDAYDQDVCIPALEELEIIDQYVYIQKLRYGERLRVDTIVDSQDFMLPPLAVEVLVENAIKHGVMKRVEGGNIHIHLYETSNDFIAEVADDGEGFDLDDVWQDQRHHVGLRNSEERLKSLCDGYLEVKSIEGVGCRVLVHIPKER